MSRYILIDNCSGYIWGDTADIGGKLLALGTRYEDIIEACRAVDANIGEHHRIYKSVDRLDANETGYFVYRADVRDSEQVAIVTDGQDQETIEAVHRDCVLVAKIKCATGG